MEEYKEVLDLIKYDIVNQPEKLSIDLQLLPFEMFNQHVLDQFIAFFLNNTIEYNSVDAIKILFNTLYDLIPIEAGQLDHITRVFGDPSIENEALIMIIQLYNQPITYYISILIQWNSDPLTVVAAKKLAFLYRDTDSSIWRYLFNTTYDILYPNMLLQEYLAEMAKEDSMKVIRPSWIINEYDTVPDELEVEEPPLLYDLPTDQEAKEIIRDKQLYNAYIIANDQDKDDIIRPYMLSLLRNMLLDDEAYPNYVKVYGPQNTLPFTDLSGDDICSKVGCRMLTCNEFHEDVDIFEEDYFKKQTDWFTGTCDYCFNTIRKRHYACRHPFKNGGWIGCYCSWECVRDNCPTNNYVELKLIDILSNTIKIIGIQDRLYYGDDNTEQEEENKQLDTLNEKEIMIDNATYMGTYENEFDDLDEDILEDIYNVKNGSVDNLIYDDNDF